MAKASSTEQDETRLQKKVQARLTGEDRPKANPALRALRKRLKRAQRKRRAHEARVLRAKTSDADKAAG